MPRISNLTSLTTPDASDELAIVDTSASVTKKITRSDFLKGAPLPNDTVTTSAITNGAVTASKIDFTTFLWSSFTPTFTNLSLGNGTLTAKYTVVGKICLFKITVLFGSTTAVSGAVSATLPQTAATFIGSSPNIGNATLLDTGTALFAGPVYMTSTTQINVRVYNAASTYLSATQLSATIPHTWANTDELVINGTYELP